MYEEMYKEGMSAKYSVAEARANLPRILHEVALGHEVELTRRGKAVAVVISVEKYARLSGGYRDFGAALDDYRNTYGGVSRATFGGVRHKTPGGGRLRSWTVRSPPSRSSMGFKS